MKHKNLVLLGTSHIAVQSINEVEKNIKKEKPDIIALELDRQRLYALLDKEGRKVGFRDIWRIGIKGFIFSLIGAWAEKRLGKEVGVSPGSEMKRAFELAKENKIKVALIDQDIAITLNKISKSLTWREKWNFVADVFKAIVLRKRDVVFDLRKVPSEKIIKKLTGKVKKRYPNLYNVLVVERNNVMADNIAKLIMKNPDEKILAIIGAGHEKEIMDIVKENLKKPHVSYSFTIN
jgi:pheromone shutdown-related protein TraB